MTITRSFGKFFFTPEGGLALSLINDTGAASERGRAVSVSSSVTLGVSLSGVNDNEAIGIMYSDGVPNGDPVFVVVQALAEVLLKDNTSATRANWVKVSSEVGYADATLAAPPGAGIPEIDEHFTEIGHCMDTVAAGGEGTHVLCLVMMHFN